MGKSYEPEEQLNELLDGKEITHLEYIARHSKEMREEYAEYCKYNGFSVEEEESAEAFLKWRDDEFERAMEAGEI